MNRLLQEGHKHVTLKSQGLDEIAAACSFFAFAMEAACRLRHVLIHPLHRTPLYGQTLPTACAVTEFLPCILNYQTPAYHAGTAPLAQRRGEGTLTLGVEKHKGATMPRGVFNTAGGHGIGKPLHMRMTESLKI